MPSRVLIIGIDCLAPELVFGKWREYLPALTCLGDRGMRARLRSTDPPVTVPAWASMSSGRDPGELGLYGFGIKRSRENMFVPSVVTGNDVSYRRIWDLAGDAGMESLVVGVPPTWPPEPMKGRLVADFLAPDLSNPGTWPPELSSEMKSLAGGTYMADVESSRNIEPSKLIRDLYLMTERRFRLFSEMLASSRTDFAMIVEMGLDRMQHAFWQYCDPEHVLYPGKGNRYENVLFEYHRFLDECIASAIRSAGPQSHVIIASDHGAVAMEGGIRINEWLISEGWLSIESGPAGESPENIPPGTPLSRCKIDMSRTVAWAEGGYAGKIYINSKDRQAHGIVSPGEYESVLERLKKGLLSIKGPEGIPLPGTVVLRPSDIYREVRGIAPDLLVYFGDLRWRALGRFGGSGTNPDEEKFGNAGPFLSRLNDLGPDGANHSLYGSFIMYSPENKKFPESFPDAGESESALKEWRKKREESINSPHIGLDECRNDIILGLEEIKIYDVFQTALALLGIASPAGSLGRNLAV